MMHLQYTVTFNGDNILLPNKTTIMHLDFSNTLKNIQLFCYGMGEVP